MEPTPVVEEGELLSIESLQGNPAGIEIVDHVQRRRCTISTPESVTPGDVSDDEFHFPVDRGVRIRTDELSLLHTVGVYVRNHAGWMVDELTSGESRTFPEDTYSIDFSAPIKLYVVFNSAFSIDVTADDVRLDFDDPSEVFIGARSHHKHPAATITTTKDPKDVMRAVSSLGSALKTTTPERSYPTLRGHPPTIEVGDRFHVPKVLEKPDTGVTIEVPPDLRYIFVVAPLAYYLGAEVVPGDQPRIVTDHGFVHTLGHPERGFEGEVERILKQSFFLDCITRTEGYYPVDLHERNEVEDQVDLDFVDLYDRSLPEQLEAYLDVPYSVVEDHVPQWKLTAHVEPTPDSLETLPFVVNDLAVVRTAGGEKISESEAAEEGLQGFFRGDSAGAVTEPDPEMTAAIDDFMRSAEGGVEAEGSSDDFLRSAKHPTRGDGGIVNVRSSGTSEGPPSDGPPQLYRVEETDSLEQTWISEGIPLGASKGMIEAFQNRLGRTLTDGDIDITVICNSEDMEDEEDDLVDQVYGSREDLPFDVRVHRNLTGAELREVLSQDTEFLHYIGHIDSNGFECADGMLNAADIEETGVDAFFLNACSSYQQGMRLIEAGAIAGVVTFADVINSGAERVGKALARLLNQGFPLRPALDIAKRESIMGGYYLVIGEGNFDVAQAESGLPPICEIDGEEEPFELTYKNYVNSNRGIGTLTKPLIGVNEEYYIGSGECGCFQVTSDQIDEFLQDEVVPFYYQSILHWSNQQSFSDVLRTG